MDAVVQCEGSDWGSEERCTSRCASRRWVVVSAAGRCAGCSDTADGCRVTRREAGQVLLLVLLFCDRQRYRGGVLLLLLLLNRLVLAVMRPLRQRSHLLLRLS